MADSVARNALKEAKEVIRRAVVRQYLTNDNIQKYDESLGLLSEFILIPSLVEL